MEADNEEINKGREEFLLEIEKLKNEIIKLKMIIEDQYIKLNHTEWKLHITI